MKRAPGMAMMGMLGILILGVHVTEVGGVTLLPELDQEWSFRRADECDAIFAAAMLNDVMNRLMMAANKGRWDGKFRDLYCNAGRALRLCDALQHRLLDMNATKGLCVHCRRSRAGCK
jgi:hypothetical protein